MSTQLIWKIIRACTVQLTSERESGESPLSSPSAALWRVPAFFRGGCELTAAFLLCVLTWLPLHPAVAGPQDVFSENVRTTEPLSPQDQLSSFTTAPDLQVDLIASEPDIQKPLNMAFDLSGRLWITCTVEYPYPAEDGQGKDQIVVLEDQDRDGVFEKKTVFADNLNIPIGLLPLGNDCLVFEIPNIWKLSDTDGDGRCDTRVKILGPFDCSRDTHGMNNSFLMGFDGWVYACHGFANRSEVAGTDGHKVQLNSGNVYRFKPDGSRIEHFSRGQVNPYGLTCDDFFSLYTADCHSKPLTQVIRGGYYPSFGAPHDGLGFAPSMMDHLHGSTAIAGVEVITGGGLPAAYTGHMVSGNVMTSRLNRNQIQWNGSQAQAIELPDLLETTDPWFRPVYVLLGPDGGLYFADFYNRIIGHYEVPLEHPGRDRERGRIWRLRARATAPSELASNLPAKPDAEIATSWWPWLDHPTPRVRALAVIEWAAQLAGSGEDRAETWKSLVAAVHDPSHPRRQIGAAWVLWHAAPNRLTPSAWQSMLEGEAEARAHAQLLLAEIAAHSDLNRQTTTGPQGTEIPAPIVAGLSLNAVVETLSAGLKDPHPRVQRASVDAAGRWGLAALIPELLRLADPDTPGDSVLKHSARIALKDALLRSARQTNEDVIVPTSLGEGVRRLPSLVTEIDESLVTQDETTPSIPRDALPEVWAAAREAAQTESQRAALASVMLAVPDPLAADYLLDYLQKTPAGSPQTIDFIQHIARHLPAHRAAEVVKLVKSQSANDLAMQWRCLTAVGDALTRSGTPTPSVVKTWAADVVIGGLTQAAEQPNFWKPINIAGGDVTPQQFNAWRLEPRPMSLAGDHGPPLRTVTMWSSLPAGETQTGAIASPEFTIPPQLSFVLAGHRGFPDQSPHQLNHISLVLADGEVIASTQPPRHDIANKVEWDLTTHQGKLGRVILHDGDSDTAYAWLAAGDFSVPELAAPRWSPSELTAQLEGWCQLVERFELFEAEPTLQKLVERTDLAPHQRLMVARSLASLRSQAFARNWAEISAQQELPSSTAHWIAHLVGHWDPNWPRESLGLETPTNELPGWPDPGTAGEHQIMLNLMTSSSGRVQREWIKAALSEPDMFDAVLTWGERGWLAPASFSGDDVAQTTQLSSRPEWTERLNSILADQVGVDQQWMERAQASKTQFSDWLNKLKSGRPIQVALPASERSSGESGPQNHLSAWRAHGQQIFKRDCAICHQIAGEGAIIGPQLDGIHRRGLERVLEDVLLPNQNVDHAFRSQLFLLNDGQVVSGLVQSEDETALIVVDQRGKQQTLPVQDVEERRISGQSLMPGDVAHQYSDAGLFSLIVYLLEPPTP